MLITIDAKEVANQLADEKTSFKSHNKVKSEIGIDYTIKDVRECAEWKRHYSYYITKLKLNKLIK